MCLSTQSHHYNDTGGRWHCPSPAAVALALTLCMAWMRIVVLADWQYFPYAAGCDIRYRTVYGVGDADGRTRVRGLFPASLTLLSIAGRGVSFW